MSEIVTGIPLHPALHEEWQTDIREATQLFMDVWSQSLATKGRIVLLDGTLDLVRTMRQAGNAVLVATHEYQESIGVDEQGTFLSRPVASKYALDLRPAADPSAAEAESVAEKAYDLSESRALFREWFNLTDDDVALQFVSGFIDKGLGQQALEEKKWQLEHRRAELMAHFAKDLPPRPETVDAGQLVSAQHLRDLLREAKRAQPRQNAHAQVSRESSED